MKKLLASIFPDISAVPEIFQNSYFNSLDGFRAISILMVIIGHYNFQWNVGWLEEILAGGTFGVSIFFVISGFLITTLLLKEKITTGRISLTQFYARRFFRIFPVAYLYLIAILALNYFYDLRIPAMAFVAAALYLRNFSFSGPGSWYVNHYWSLAVEEQFYLIFPVILKWSIRKYCVIISTVIVSISVYSFFYYRYDFLSNWQLLYDFFGKGLEAILIGSLFSIFVYQNRINWAFFKRWNHILNFVFAASILALQNNLFNKYVFHMVPSFLASPLENSLIALLIVNNLQHSSGLFFRFLNNRMVIWIGMLSYSLYIWQQLFTLNELHAPGSSIIPWYRFPVNVLLLVGVSAISWKYFEKPIRELRKRLMRS